MKTRAAVAFEKAKPLQITEVDLDGPKAGEVMVEVKAPRPRGCLTSRFLRSCSPAPTR
jgi:S-(hydroxymethyl)glutathione dehydrogenase / alcohol dehydrogenase